MNEQLASNIKKPRIFYFDAIRAVAILAVIIFHLYTACCSEVLNYYANMHSLQWIITDIIASDFRFGVDLFFMISGALLLGRSTNVKEFLVKKIPRIAVPFVFWVIVLSIVSLIVSFIIPDVWHVMNSVTPEQYLNFLSKCFLSRRTGFTHLWFFWTILGIYLIIPLINKIFLNIEMKDIEYFLGLWFLTCIFDYTLGYALPVKLTYFTGPLGLFVLGYYLRYTDRRIFNNPYISLVTLIITAGLSFTASFILSDANNIYFFENMSVFNVVESVAIFTLIKNFNKFELNLKFIQNPNGLVRKSIMSLAQYSYGIYLIHRLILAVTSQYLMHIHVDYYILLIVGFSTSLFLSWAIIMILSKVSLLKNVVN